MKIGGRAIYGTVLCIAILLVVGLHRDTFQSIVEKWLGDSSFSHGLLVVPISLWLCWTQRALLRATAWRTDWAGVLALLVLGAAWFVARATGVLVVEQFAAMAMIPAVVLAVLGRDAARVLAFPLLFLLLAVPAGRGLVPWLMQNTADIAAAALRISGVPVVRDGMLLSIPGGDFEVARACSGLNYLVTGFTLGVLYAYLTYSSTRKRILFMIAALVVPMVLNGLRAYLIIAIAHLTDMSWGTGPEHVTFGRVLFLGTMLVMFWVGLRWRDPPESFRRRPREVIGTRSRTVGEERATAAATLLVIMVPALYLDAALAKARADVGSQASQVTLPAAAPGWQGPRANAAVWRPQYSGSMADRAAAYDDLQGHAVDVYVAVYGLGLSGGGEMVSYRNRLSERELESLLPQRDLPLDLAGQVTTVREFIVPTAGGARLAWRWYMVGDRVLRSDVQVKTAEAVALLRGGGASDRVIVLSTSLDGDESAARARLHAFIRAHDECVRSGFLPDACHP